MTVSQYRPTLQLFVDQGLDEMLGHRRGFRLLRRLELAHLCFERFDFVARLDQGAKDRVRGQLELELGVARLELGNARLRLVQQILQTPAEPARKLELA